MFAPNQNVCAHLKNICAYQNIRFQSKYMRTSWNICAYPEYLLPCKIFAPSKYSLTSKIFAPYLKYLRIYKIYAPHQECLRLIIYDSNKAAVEIFTPYERCMRPKNRRPNSYYLGSAESPTPSQSGWRALVQVMLSLLHADLKWGSALRPPSLYGRRLCRTVPAVVPARPAKIFAPCPNVRGREYFHLFSGKNRKFNSAHKCPITSVQIRTWSQKLSEFSCNTFEPLNRGCAADFSLLNLPKGKSLGRSKPATNS
jgi:hypothetical protein